MSSFFNMDSPLWRFLGRLADIMILNIVFLITCIPIVTIGAAWTSLSYVTLKMSRDEESYIVKSYFKAFRQNFRQATVIWILTLAVMLIFYMDFHIIRNMASSMVQIMYVLLSAIALLFGLTLLYVFPVLAKFDNTILNTIKNAFLISISNLPRTLLMLVVIVGSAVLTFLSQQTIAVGLLLWTMIGFALIAFLNAHILVKIFDRYIPDDSKTKNASEDSIDASVFQNLHPTEESGEEDSSQG